MKSSIFQVKRNYSVLGIVTVCAYTREMIISEILNIPKNQVSATVDFIGVPAIISAKEDSKIAEIYNSATIAAIDGMPIVKMAKRSGINCERCAGPEIMGRIFEESVKLKKTHYFYGGKNEEVLNKLKTNLEKNYPGIKIVGMYSPPFRQLTKEEDVDVCNEINQLKPDFLWVGIGAPKQERWMYEHRNKIGETVMLGVGAAFDFFAGTLDKAPEWISKAGFEWLFRLIKEPKRLWKRYVLGGFKFLYYSCEYRLKKIKE